MYIQVTYKFARSLLIYTYLNPGLKFSGNVFSHTLSVISEKLQSNITAAETPEEGICVRFIDSDSMMSIITNDSFVHSLGIHNSLYHTLLAFPMIYHDLLCVPMRSCAFTMNPNWSLLEIIYQPCALLYVHFGPELAFVGDSPIQ